MKITSIARAFALKRVKIKNFFTVTDDIHEAAEKGNVKKLKYLIKIGVDVNKYSLGSTPLQCSLLYKKPGCVECTILLLQNGADPNAKSKLEALNGLKTLQIYLDGGHISKIRLLAIYGATADGVSFIKASSPTIDVFMETHRLYVQRVKLEKEIKSLSVGSPEWQASSLKLSKIWGELSKK